MHRHIYIMFVGIFSERKKNILTILTWVHLTLARAKPLRGVWSQVVDKPTGKKPGF
ncbi:MAG: hypothetical protein GDA56_30280 [Hormoscilla sp. GM7CHS1pb]|nr:hypothetical protein [Hormoscilla sp. GM7CHS1pb]